MNDKDILELSIQLLFEGIRNSTSGHSEKEKMKGTISFMMRDFLCLQNVNQLRKQSNNLKFMNEDVHEMISLKDYYEAKEKESFVFEKYTNNQDEQMKEEEEEEGSHYQIRQYNYRHNEEVFAQVQTASVDMCSNSVFIPYLKPEYKLLYGSQLFYVFFK